MLDTNLLQGITLLAIEDEPITQLLLRETLEYAGGIVTVVTTYHSALERLEVEHFDIILSNIVLPDGDGYRLMSQWRTRERVLGLVTTPAIADAFNNGMEYFNTFGGNPVSMSTGMAVLEVIREEELQRHALEVGKFFMDGLKRLMAKYQIIGDVRGSGLFIGAEMVRDRETLEPAVPEIDIVVEKMKYRGFLISTDGPLHNVLKIKPPVIFSRENAETFIANLDEVLSEF